MKQLSNNRVYYCNLLEPLSTSATDLEVLLNRSSAFIITSFSSLLHSSTVKRRLTLLGNKRGADRVILRSQHSNQAVR